LYPFLLNQALTEIAKLRLNNLFDKNVLILNFWEEKEMRNNIQ